MPAMVLGSVSMAYIIRLSRSEISSNIALDYVRTARAKGMDNRSVMNRHVLRNSMIPVVTYLGQDLGALMGGAMISETIFNVHGIGYLTYQSILKGEGNPGGVHCDSAYADLSQCATCWSICSMRRLIRESATRELGGLNND